MKQGDYATKHGRYPKNKVDEQCTETASNIDEGAEIHPTYIKTIAEKNFYPTYIAVFIPSNTPQVPCRLRSPALSPAYASSTAPSGH